MPHDIRTLVVSLHDVSPRTRVASDTILRELRTLGIAQTSLLVIPNHHERGHFLEDQNFCAWLHEQAEAGHEIVIHGYTHQRARRAAESARAKLTTRIYTAGEGEFFDLDFAAATALVQKARGEFRQLGFEPAGFIAPAWLLSGGAERALRELGFIYTTRLGSVLDLRSGRTEHSQSLVWSVRAAWRRVVSLAWNAFLFRKLRTNPLLRISIHPVDLDHPRIWRQIRRFSARALETRTALTYGEKLSVER